MEGAGISAGRATPGAGLPAALAPAAESAAALDRAFQAARARINAEALALDSMPAAARRTPAYATRFDALRRATLHADSVRRMRDRLARRGGR